jgi:hypothetical protein
VGNETTTREIPAQSALKIAEAIMILRKKNSEEVSWDTSLG